MSISVRCSCGQSYKVPETAAGKRVKCSKCGGAVAVPAAASGVAKSAVAKSGGGPTTKPQKPKPKVSDPDDEFGGALDSITDDGDSAALPPRALPPRAGGAAEAEERRSSGPARPLPSWATDMPLEERMRARSEAAYEQAFFEYRLKQMAFGVMFIIAAGVAFWGLHVFETSGRMERVPGPALVLYSMVGKWGTTIVLTATGIWKLYLGYFGHFFRGDEEGE